MSLGKLWLIWAVASWFAYVFALSGFTIHDWQTYVLSLGSFGVTYLISRPTKRAPDAGDSGENN